MIKLFSFFNSKKKPTPNVVSDTKNIPNPSQRQSTQEIIADTPLDTSFSVEELSNTARERSDRLYEERQQRISKFNPLEIKAVYSTNPQPLSSTEKYFLKQMHGQNISTPTVYAYWTYDYSINFEELMKKLIENGYLQLSNAFFDAECLTVSQLKEVLKKYNLKLTGKKAELIKRLYDNVAEEILASDIGSENKKYMLTPLGKETTANLPNSMTKNIELEDACLKYIYSNDFNTAYKLVCENELKKIIPRGIGVDWNAELSNGLSTFKIDLFNNFIKDNSFPVPNFLKSYTKELKACTILGIFFGTDARKIANLFKRIAKSDSSYMDELVQTIQKMEFMLLDAIQDHSFDILQS